MQFLKSKLKGEAGKIVQHLQISTDNYQVRWAPLNHRSRSLCRINKRCKSEYDQEILLATAVINVQAVDEQSDLCASVSDQENQSEPNPSVHKITSPVLLKCNFRKTC
ncbi:unnamed protein product [Parnassius mnemosyne]|uniref:Uncharacterized protein n=1 Tax=Parnassius mnemosyne TaxID=213953 RepID=A0AAV1MBB4_9NEOP